MPKRSHSKDFGGGGTSSKALSWFSGFTTLKSRFSKGLRPFACNEKNIEGESKNLGKYDGFLSSFKGENKKIFSLHTLDKRKIAFTLAEVLITLGIIGVVAAMTLPALLNKTRSKELQTAFLKTYSELNQIAYLFVADNGISVADYAAASGSASTTSKKVFSYYKGGTIVNDGGQGTEDEEGNFKAYYDMYNLNGSSYSGGANSSGKNSSFLCDNSVFRDNQGGALFIFNDVPSSNKNGPVICVDINGKKGPNRYGIDYFMFIFTVDGKVLPMGQEHKNNPSACTSSSGSCNNFSNVGAQYCSATSNSIAYNTSCAYYALSNTHPTEKGKDYWKDFVGEVYHR